MFLFAPIAFFACGDGNISVVQENDDHGHTNGHGHSHGIGNSEPIILVKPHKHAYCSGDQTKKLDRFTEVIKLGSTSVRLFVEPGVAVEIVELVVSTIEDTNVFIQTVGEAPAELRVVICESFPAPRALKTHNPVLVFGQDLIEADENAQRAVLIHEYSHAIFEEILHQDIDATGKNHPPHFEPFVELFSDTVAVFLLADGTSIRSALETAFPSQVFAERDFTIRHVPNPSLFDSPAAMTAPLRSILWREYQKRIKDGEENAGPEILRALATASVRALLELEAGTDKRPILLKPNRINDLILRHLIDQDALR